ncbi:Protoporphyrinogen oxidase [Lachnellula suecica]|uniref:Protoporphyrinogen oxidase n=1 Tax=Lachnellula suecica TaxID=602035 RepID=A0A8T9CIP1_9HELO|nr:Protoporphyrinogen oxidase [Lachnellula suecica]
MRSQLPEHAVATLLRQCFAKPTCRISRQSLRTIQVSRTLARGTRSILEEQRRCYQTQSRHIGDEAHPAPSNVNFQAHHSDLEQSKATTPNDDGVTRIAVLGAGITGLASAHYLARELPHAKITIYEGSSRVGGWLRTEQFGDADGKVHIEQGPRTLRPGSNGSPAGLTTLEVIQDLGLEDELLITGKNSAAAQNRFVYYPDRLVKMPGPGQNIFNVAWSLFTDPIFKGFVYGLGTEFTNDRRSSQLQDESVGSFLNRRCGTTNIADNVTSAVLHGIYAGDVYKLSVKSLLPLVWHLEGMYGSITKGFGTLLQQKKSLVTHPDLQLTGELLSNKLDPSLLIRMQQASVYTFKAGLGTLSAVMEDRLKANPNVEFKINTKVKSVEHDVESDKIAPFQTDKRQIQTAPDALPTTYNRVISTISGRALLSLSTEPLPSLASIHAVTVMVVNLFFSEENLLPQRGFGYLIPRSISFDQNPERALGVIFDTDATLGQDSMPGTKVTVMLGGHWWDNFESYPTEEEGIAMARAILKRHLKVEAEPVLAKAGLQKDCIPQYTVGHEARMKKGHSELRNAFGGKLAVAGNSYTGVGVNDCVRAARDVVMGVAKGKDVTGLESFAEQKAWVLISRDTGRP